MKLDNNYNFIEHEKEILDFWEKDNTFKKLLEKNKDGKKYRFIDGPITANNSMKIHHVWGRTLKDTFLRYKAMNGYTSHYRNGFDGQGLWVEVEVEKELGFKTKKEIEEYGLDKFTEACVNRVKKYAEIITEQSKKLGQWMDWNNSYYTLTDENITSIWYFLKKCHENGWIVESYRPMPWCKRCGTSLSEHEMSGSYHDVEHEAVFFKLPLKDREENILVWTTTPWTLSANVALAVHPYLEYASIKFDKEEKPLIMCLDVYEKRFKKDGGKILKTFKGKELDGLEYETCFPELEKQDFVHKIVLWEDVSNEDGSGVVHIAPGCGAEDFDLGMKIGLPIVIPVDENGVFYEGFGFYSGKKTDEVPKLVFEELKKRGKLYFTHKIKHSYPFCWRCKEDIIFRLDKGYAIAVDELRPKLIANAKKVKWYPEYQGKRMIDWLENMSNWNISRKRFYGLPLPFYKCECGHLTVVGSKEELKELSTDKNLVDNIKELHRPWIDEIKIKCPKCGKEVSRVTEVGDVWLDAGIVPFSTLKYFTDKEYWKNYFPAEYVVEMHEQIRLWFYSMLFMSTVIEGVPPYEAVGTHGMVQAEDGSKFSKTGFNISFEEATDKIGVDASRYLYASANPVNNVRFGFNLGDEAKRKLMSLWNMVIFFNTYASIDKVDLTNLKPNISDLTTIDKWLIKITDDFIESSTAAMNNYSSKDVCDNFEKYVDDVSNFYIRVNRRRYWKSEDDIDKKIAYYVLFNAIKTATLIMAPIIPFMTEYIWQNLIKTYDKNSESSVHLSNWPKTSGYNIEDTILKYTDYARNIITIGLKLRNENSIKVRQPLSTIYLESKNYDENVKKYEEIIKSELNIKELKVLENFDELKDEYMTLNFKNAGMKFKGDVNKVKELLENVKDDKKLINELKNKGEFKLDKYTLEKDLIVINYKEKDTIRIASENNLTVGLNIEITKELKEEGLLRDIIRECQVFRKNAGYNVSDRINIEFITDNEEIKNVINNNKNVIESELLATISEVSKPTFESDTEDKTLHVKMIVKSH